MFASLVVLMGCRPSIHEVVKVISAVPLGTSRAEMWNTLAKAYPKKVRPYELTTPPLAMTEGMIKADKNLIEVFHRKGGFVYVFPSNLYDKLPDKAYSDMVGLIREASDGDGSLEIIYDSNTNYIGFLANAYK